MANLNQKIYESIIACTELEHHIQLLLQMEPKELHWLRMAAVSLCEVRYCLRAARDEAKEKQ